MENLTKTAAELRKALHEIPESSRHEPKTQALLQAYLKKHTSLSLHSCGNGFYAAYRAKNPKLPAIALRADFDAVPVPGGSAHLCGHDGHSAALFLTALLTERTSPDRTVFFLFQPDEETGSGAQTCLSLFEQESVSEIYGAHNLPGFTFGEVFCRENTFACGSLGLTLILTGKPAHAAYPEDGISPAAAVGSILSQLPALYGKTAAMTLCTVIGVSMGSPNFGKAASDARIFLTLRAERTEDLHALRLAVLNLAETLAAKERLQFSYEEQDVFPATENDPACAARVLTECSGRLLKTPMRWSEDFGHYLTKIPGAFFGIGAGKIPALHTAEYEYPDDLLLPTAKAFLKLITRS